MNNIDPKTVASFGDEWARFDQSGMTKDEARKVFGEYFAAFPWETLPANAEGFDMGCGSGRWAYWVAPRVGLCTVLTLPVQLMWPGKLCLSMKI
ncbi:hypothetical protein [Candidatus Electrothrix sp.]|uniref:hypothetical protein n=1 Tax=Candidatus Electrothrix sp. TaxID=2170559 RepID=UPI0040578FF3